MSSVYGNSHINIAASSARNINEGCFLKPPSFVGGFRARVTINGSSLVRDFRYFSEYDKSITWSYLATRGWTLQEKLLPARTIHFGDRGAFWECKASLATEFLPEGFSKIYAVPILDPHRKKDFRFWWMTVVELYSDANLTFDEDKLPAISGIARRSHEEEGMQYLAGMWRDQLELDLCWEATKLHKRPIWRAPSWSWASINGRVNMEDSFGLLFIQSNFLSVCTHVVEAKTTYLDNNPFGAVTGGWLRVTCSGLLLARLVQEDSVKLLLNNNTDFESSPELQFARDCLDEEIEKDAGIVYLLPIFGCFPETSYGQKGENEDKDDSDDDGKLGNIDSDQESSQENEQEGEHDEDDVELIKKAVVCGIVLRKTGHDPGEFRRIGAFKFWDGYGEEDDEDDEDEEKEETEEKKEGEDLCTLFLDALELHGEETARGICAEVIENTAHPGEKYVITII
jgi:hypothetical protein